MSAADIPRAWRDVARFGSADRVACKPEDLAAYLDAYPLLPQRVRIPLEDGEVAYLVRPAERAWEEGVRDGGVAALGPLIPLTGPLGAWVRQVPRPPTLPGRTLHDRAEGTLYLTNWRLLFVRSEETDSILLADVSGVEYFRDALVCTLSQQHDRMVLTVQETLQVGLCLARAIRSLAHWIH